MYNVKLSFVLNVLRKRIFRSFQHNLPRPATSSWAASSPRTDVVLSAYKLSGQLQRLRLVFSASAVAKGTSKAARLPKISSLIERIEVTAGGVVVDAGVHNQNALMQALDNVKVRELDPVDTHSKIYRNVSGVNMKAYGGANSQAASTVAEDYTNANKATFF